MSKHPVINTVWHFVPTNGKYDLIAYAIIKCTVKM